MSSHKVKKISQVPCVQESRERAMRTMHNFQWHDYLHKFVRNFRFPFRIKRKNRTNGATAEQRAKKFCFQKCIALAWAQKAQISVCWHRRWCDDDEHLRFNGRVWLCVSAATGIHYMCCHKHKYQVKTFRKSLSCELPPWGWHRIWAKIGRRWALLMISRRILSYA